MTSTNENTAVYRGKKGRLAVAVDVEGRDIPGRSPYDRVGTWVIR